MLSGDYIYFEADGLKYVYTFIGESGTYGTGTALLMDYHFLLIFESDTTADLAQPSKFFKCLLSQTGTSNPTAIVHKNDLGAYALTRNSGFPGEYYFNCAGAFPLHKTYPKIWPTNNLNFVARRLDNDTIVILTTSTVTGAIDNYLDGTPFEIEIMP